jgi:hypothetical protein
MNIKNPTCNKICQAEIRIALANAKVLCDNLFRLSWGTTKADHWNTADQPECAVARGEFLDGKRFLSGFTPGEVVFDCKLRSWAACKGRPKARASRTPDCNCARDEFNHVKFRTSDKDRIFPLWHISRTTRSLSS